jgi:hypothetical protein
MGHETIALGYLSKNIEAPFSNSALVETIDRHELFFHPDGYRYRVALEARVDSLRETLCQIRESGSRFEMIYGFQAAPRRRSDWTSAAPIAEGLERAKGIEPSYAAWEAAVLPLNYARDRPHD